MGFFTLSSDHLFLPSLANLVAEQGQKNPAALHEMTIFLPTRRATKTLKNLLLEKGVIIMPRIFSVSGLRIEDIFWWAARAGHTMPQMPSSISEQRYLLLLMTLVRQFFQQRATHLGIDGICRLTTALKKLLDECLLEEVPIDSFQHIFPESFAIHHQEAAAFLDILRIHLPTILKGEGGVSAIEYQQVLLQSVIDLWITCPPQTPVIAAGITGAIPLVGRFLRVIAELPLGQVILPGFDAIGARAASPYSPQFAMGKMLQDNGVCVDEVRPLMPPPSHGSFRRVFDAPAEVPTEALQGLVEKVRLCTCTTPEEEATAIGIHIRKILEHPTEIVSVVTPDRAVAERVSLQLKRWKIRADDSAGRTFFDTPEGTFLGLSAQMMGGMRESVPFFALLKHPLVVPPTDILVYEMFMTELERWVRDKVPRPSIPWALEAVRKTVPLGVASEAWDVVYDYIRQGIHHIDTLHAAGRGTEALSVLLPAHQTLVYHLRGQSLLDPLFKGEGVSFSWPDLVKDTEGISAGSMSAYVSFWEIYLKSLRVQEQPHLQHPRVHVLGILEARLIVADHIILAGFNEQAWPGNLAQGSWISEKMRLAVGLPPLAQKAGLIAHDVLMLLSAPSVLITRSLLENDTPTTPSRYLLALQTAVSGAGLSLKSEEHLLQLARALSCRIQGRQLSRPCPTPPVSHRPTTLSVTDIGILVRNPYVIYAKHVLQLKPLATLTAESPQRDFGIMMHRLFYEHVKAVEGGGTIESDLFLDKLLRQYFAAHPFFSFWRAKTYLLYDWFCDTFSRRTTKDRENFLEVPGELRLDLEGGHFTIRGVADRIAHAHDGTAEIIDYKTGYVPTMRQVEWGVYPQLTLEALIYTNGTFQGISAPQNLTRLSYWCLGGQGDGDVGSIVTLPGEVEALCASTLTGVQALLKEFANPKTPYRATREVIAPEYDLLTRTQEWMYGNE